MIWCVRWHFRTHPAKSANSCVRPIRWRHQTSFKWDQLRQLRGRLQPGRRERDGSPSLSCRFSDKHREHVCRHEIVLSEYRLRLKGGDSLVSDGCVLEIQMTDKLTSTNRFYPRTESAASLGFDEIHFRGEYIFRSIFMNGKRALHKATK